MLPSICSVPRTGASCIAAKQTSNGPASDSVFQLSHTFTGPARPQNWDKNKMLVRMKLKTSKSLHSGSTKCYVRSLSDGGCCVTLNKAKRLQKINLLNKWDELEKLIQNKRFHQEMCPRTSNSSICQVSTCFYVCVFSCTLAPDVENIPNHACASPVELLVEPLQTHKWQIQTRTIFVGFLHERLEKIG